MASIVKKLFCCGTKSFPVDVELPKGNIWVTVGTAEEEQRKLEFEANFLNHPLFKDLLRLSADEFGNCYTGALRIACEIDLFLHVIDLLKSNNPSLDYMELQDLIDGFYCNARQPGPSGCLHNQNHNWVYGIILYIRICPILLAFYLIQKQ